MGFINNLRKMANDILDGDNPSNDKLDKNYKPKSNPLDEFSLYNFNDVLNDIYIIDDLRQQGRENDAYYAYKSFTRHGVKFDSRNNDIGSFMTYLSEIADVRTDEELQSETEIDVKSSDEDLLADKADATISQQELDNEQFVKAIVLDASKYQNNRNKKLDDEEYQIGYDSLTKFLDLSHGKDIMLTADEYAIVSGYKSFTQTKAYKSVTKQFVKEYPLPDVRVVDDIYDTPDLSDLYDAYAKDEYFKKNYRIANIYEITPNKQSANAHKQGSKSIHLNTG